MCIIIVKPADSPLPSKETLDICMTNNPDGAGYMYRRKKVVHIVKGFFDIEALWKSLQAVKDEDVCIHFRWATHGEVDRGNCHPFPVTGSVQEMRHTRSHTRMAIAHNGIIHGVTASKLISDTMMFIKHMDKSKSIESQLLKDDGKFCVFTEHKSYLIGDFIYEKGCYFSNDDFREVNYYLADTAKTNDTLLEHCMTCKAATCEGCPFLDAMENEWADAHMAEDNHFKKDYRDLDIDEAINECR